MSDQSQFRNAMTDAERMAAKLIIETGKLEEECFSLARFALTLPEPYRRTVELFHVHGLSVGDVAVALGAKPNTVKTHLARGRAMLQRAIEGRLREGGYL